MSVRLGSRVAYRDNHDDYGTVIDILLDEHPFVVKWDEQRPSEYKTSFIQTLDKTLKYEYNPADENVDQFKGSQLRLIKY